MGAVLAAIAAAVAVLAIAVACRIRQANRSSLRLVRAIRRIGKAANDNARQSFVYKVEHRKPRRW